MIISLEYRKEMIFIRITRLELTNFLPILAGTGKEHIEIDLEESHDLITVLIGKIGSGKTYILSHLQPFSTVGTLDIRNGDDPIIPEKDGKKIIMYEKNGHTYKITHEYKWTGKSHSKKSYIEKDGIELNENGNGGSFKDIVQIELGIDPSFLRLLRLGPNVINFINMKATERKSYIASLLEDTELYLMLYKYWSSDLRTLNTQANILMNKLSGFGDKSLEELTDELEDLEESIQSQEQKVWDLNSQKFQIDADNKALLQDMTYQQFQQKIREYDSEVLPNMKEELASVEASLKKFESYPPIDEVSKEIGSLNAQLAALEEKMEENASSYNEICEKLHVLKDKKTMSSNEEHVKMLQETYQQLLEKDALYKKDLQFFTCDYTSTFLSGFNGDLNTINILINEVSQYDMDMIKTLYRSDNSCIRYAQKQIEILGYRKLKVQKLINNLSYSQSYEASQTLFFPPMCPTKSCPYYKTHPVTLQKKYGKKDAAKEQLIVYQNELKELDIEIYKYNDYPILYSKIESLKGYWKKAVSVLKNIGALRQESLLDVLTNPNCRVWYNYDKIIDTIELLEKRDRYFELTEKLKIVKNELNELSLANDESVDKEISSLEGQKVLMEGVIESCENGYADIKSQLVENNQMYVELSERSSCENIRAQLTKHVIDLADELDMMTKNHEIIQSNIQNIDRIQLVLVEENQKLKVLREKLDQLKTKINDMRYTNEELENVLLSQKYMTYMVDSVSAKKGIPLEMVKIFLDSCRDIVNEMIYDVCEDDLEILPFDITDTEFKIPYLINGKTVEDIGMASQGQSSIVSTAMSFALVRQAGSEYTIPLLDEMDAPLHKRDKQKFISILLKHLKEIGSEQCFVITHDSNTFDSYPVQVIMTTDENVDVDRYTNVIKI